MNQLMICFCWFSLAHSMKRFKYIFCRHYPHWEQVLGLWMSIIASDKTHCSLF